MKKKLLAILLTVCMVLSMAPAALAADGVIDTEAELSAALAAGGTVTLGGNIEVSTTIEVPSGVTATLDLNGKAITVGADPENSSKTIYALYNRGTLTIKDSGENGEIVSHGLYNYGTMTLESGIISADGVGGGGHALRTYGDFTMNGGTIRTIYDDDPQGTSGTKDEYTYIGADPACIKIYNDATVTLNGGTITNICNASNAISVNGTLMIPASTTVVVNSCNSAFGSNVTDGEPTVTIAGGTFNISGGFNMNGSAVVVAAGGTWNISGGTFTAKHKEGETSESINCPIWGLHVGEAAAANVTVTGGTFAGEDGAVYFNASYNPTLSIEGGTFSSDVSEYTAYGYKYENGAVVEDTAVGAAKIGTTKYETLAAAVAAAKSGDTIKMLNDVTLTETVTIPESKSVTLDLNGKTIATTSTVATSTKDDTKTITKYLSAVDNDGTLTVQDSSADADGKIASRGIRNDGTLTLNSGTIASCDGSGGHALDNYGTFVMNGGTLCTTYDDDPAGSSAYGTGYVSGDPSALRIRSGSATLNGGVINSVCNMGYGVSISGGTLTVPETSTIKVTGIHGAILTSGATVNIAGGEFMCTGAQATGGSYVIDCWFSNTLNITGGTFTTKLSEGFTPVHENDDDIYVLYVDVTEAGVTTDASISGGTFSEAETIGNWLVEGYKAEETSKGSGVYGIVIDPENDVFEAAIGSVGYETLAAAINAAEAGDTVELLDDVTLTETLTVPAGKDITLDLNGKVISGTCNANQASMIVVSNTADLTIKDSSTDGTGKITYAAGTSNVGFALDVKGDLILESGTIELTGSWSMGFAVDVRPNSWGSEYTEGTTFVMNGGKIVSSDTAVRVASSSAADHENVSASFTMNGGEIDSDWDAIFIHHWSACDYDVTLNDGTISGENSAVRIYGDTAVNDVNLTITGGTFTGALKNLGVTGEGETVVSGGSFTDNTVEAYLADGYVLESYTVGDGNTMYGVEPVYTVNITIPDGAAIVVKDSDGNEVNSEEDGSYKVVNGTYTYTVSNSGYNTKAGTFTVNGADMSFSVSLSIYVPYVPSTPSYSVTVSDAANGTVTVRPSAATSGSTVTITVTPDAGYTLETLTVLNQNGKEIELTYKGDGKYTFKMPASKVTVYATFMEDNTMLNYFTDVFASDYYYDAVLWAVENGITNGTSATTFSPDAVCTRAQVVTFLWRAAGSPEPVSTVMPFTDVAADAYYYKAVLWAVENGITNGTSATTFSPDADCTRGQIVTFLWRAQGSEDASGYNPFVDVANDAYYTEAVLWAVENGITNGTGANTFSPDADCTRGQIVTFLYRCLAE